MIRVQPRSFAALSLFPFLLAAQNWPSFRGERASGVADGKPLAVKWSAEKNENIAWKTPIPGLGLSSPVVWGDYVFLTTAVSSDPNSKFRHGLYGDVEPAADQSRHSFRAYAIDKKTGKILWERVAHEGVPKTKRHPKSSFATSTPASDGRHVVFLFGSEGLFCYDFKGKLLWKKDLGVLDAGWFYDPDYQWGHGSSPIIYKDMVIVQADIQANSFLAAYSLKDGREIWKARRDEVPSWGTPAIYEDGRHTELVTHATKAIRGYDPATGKELWTLGPNSEVTAPTPFVAHGLIYVTNGYRGIQPIYAIRPGGRGDLTLPKDKDSSEFIAWSKKNGGPYMPTPVVYGDLFYTCANNGVLTVYNAKTGERVYQQRLAHKGGGYSGSPVAGDGKVYFPSEDGEVHVVKAGPTYEFLASNPMGEVLMASPAISDGMILVRGLKTLFAVAEKPQSGSAR
jgi:outer membrane protein assembly factor BamB